MTVCDRARVAAVTGAGRGLGEAIARRFGDTGWSVVVLDRDGEAAKRVVEEIDQAGGAAVRAVVDLCDRDAPEQLVTAAVDGFGSLDVLVNNAGIAPLTPFLDIDRDDLRAMLEINFEVHFLATQAAVRRMIQQGRGGCVINMGTIHTIVGISGGASYAAAKAALTAWTKELAIELAPHRIRCNVIAPGTIATARVERELTEEQKDVRRRRIPLGRLGTEADIAGCAVFLASPDADFITGQTLLVDGGFTAMGVS